MHGKGFVIKKYRKDFPIKWKYFEDGKSSQCRISLSKDFGFNQPKNLIKRKISLNFKNKSLWKSQIN